MLKDTLEGWLVKDKIEQTERQTNRKIDRQTFPGGCVLACVRVCIGCRQLVVLALEIVSRGG